MSDAYSKPSTINQKREYWESSLADQPHLLEILLEFDDALRETRKERDEAQSQLRMQVQNAIRYKQDADRSLNLMAITLEQTNAQLAIAVEGLECILKKNPSAVNQFEAADMAVEFHMGAHKALAQIR